MTLTTMTITTAGGLEIEVLRGGHGIKLVYLHPASAVSIDDRFVNALAERFEVFAIVAPGFDDLAQIDEIRSVHDMAMVYDDILEALGLTNVPVVGHSFGGMFAAELAAHSPHRVAKLVLIAPVGLWNENYPALDISATPPAEIQQYVWADPSGDIAQAGMGGTPPVSVDERTELIIRTVQGLVTVGKFMMPIPDKGLVRRLYRIKAPTRLVWGDLDRIVPAAYAPDFEAGIASCDATIIEGAGHMVTYERTAEVIDAIDAHLRGKAPGAHDGLLIKHIDDLPWHEVRIMLVDGVRSVVKNRFVDFGEHRTICHTWYDPGIALATHSHFSEELIYILSGGIHIGEVWCPEGTVIVLEPGTYFGPLVAGPEGAYLLEAFRGVGIRSGQDRTGWDEVAAKLKVEPLPDPPFNPPVTA
jgi:pimeloyl-ACP methyl ester carboxylesterase